MNGIIVIDKPASWTSHDVVGKLRGILKERKIGHGGTLDPMATGVLPVFIGRATRAISFCENAEKEYVAGLRLGVTTDTQDSTGRVLRLRENHVSREELQTVLRSFTGKQLQTPPMYSAVKINGQKMYELARKGIEVERKPREIEIKELELLPENGEMFMLRVVCSKGTYIRTLCHDIGEKLGCGGVMASLVRTRAGAFEISQAVCLEQVEKDMQQKEIHRFLLPVDSLFSHFPTLVLDAEKEKKCRNGNDFPVYGREEGKYRVYGEDGSFLMLGALENGRMKTVKSFFEVK